MPFWSFLMYVYIILQLDIPAGLQVWRCQGDELKDHLNLSAQEVDCDKVIEVTTLSP